MVRKNVVENNLGTTDQVTNNAIEHCVLMTNSSSSNQESDHDYGFAPTKNGCPSQNSEINCPSDYSGTHLLLVDTSNTPILPYY